MTNEVLAIDGGTPVFSSPPPAWPTSTNAIKEAVASAIEDGSWGKYDSHWSTRLSEKIRDRFQTEHVLNCSSGTIAVELALRGVAVNTGDEVILAGYDFPGNFRAIEAVGAFPVLIDVIENGWVIDTQQFEQALSPQTSAVIVSHLHGQIADLASIRKIVDSHNASNENQIAIIEDACQTPGGALNGQSLGSLGDVGCLSFGGSKLLSAGRGGAVITNSAEILQRCIIFNSRGNEAFPLSQLQAAVLCPQLDRLPELTQRRNQNATQILGATRKIDSMFGLVQLPSIDLRSTSEPTSLPAYYKLPWILKSKPGGWSRSDFIAAIQAEGVPIDAGFRGFTRRSPRRCRKVGMLPNSQIASDQTLLLHHPFLLEPPKTIEMVAFAIGKVANDKP